MNNPQLKAVHPILETIERLSRAVSPFDDAKASPRASRPAVLDDQEMTRLRVELRKDLLKLRADLGQSLAERECYLALFPLVVCIDEFVQTRYTGVGREWPLLQQEFFKVDQGGELFYQTIDQVLDGGRQSPIIYEVFYFCLAVGFRGKHAGEEDRISGYMRRLSERFDLVAFQVEERGTVVSGAVKPVLSHWWLYLGAVLAVVLFYILLAAVSNEPDPPDMAPVAQEEGPAAVTPAPPGPGSTLACRCLDDAARPPAGRVLLRTGAGAPDRQGGPPERRLEESGADGEEAADEALDEDALGDPSDGDPPLDDDGEAEEETRPASSTPRHAAGAADGERDEVRDTPPPPAATAWPPPGQAPTCRAEEDVFPGAT